MNLSLGAPRDMLASLCDHETSHGETVSHHLANFGGHWSSPGEI